MPALLVLDTSLVLRKGDDHRTLPLVDFYLDYMQNALEPGEFVEKILIPRIAKTFCGAIPGMRRWSARP
jgi:xanthine dehydrogenase small subunit